MPTATFQDGVSPSGAYNVPDVTIFEDTPDTVNNGLTAALYADFGTDVRRYVSTWDLSSIPGGATITSAMFRARKTANPDGQPATNMEAAVIGDAVDESVTTWNTVLAGGGKLVTPAPLTIPRPSGTDGVGVISDFAEIGPLAQWARDNNAGILNLLIKFTDADEADGINNLTLRSSDDATPAVRPQLVITYTEAGGGGGPIGKGSIELKRRIRITHL